MAKVIIGMGIPGSGKTTFLKELSRERGCEYISSDDIRTELSGETSDMTKGDSVWLEIKKRGLIALEEGRDVIIDAVFSNPQIRQEILGFFKENYNAEIQGIYIDTPLEIAEERNAGRERVVPNNVIVEMKKQFIDFPPDAREGFDTIFILDENHHLEKVNFENEGESVTREFHRPV
jgi:predicted kinase